MITLDKHQIFSIKNPSFCVSFAALRLCHSHGDPTSLAPHERLTDLAVVPREKPHTGAAAREQPRDSPVIQRGGPSPPAWPSDQSRDLSPNASGGLTPLSPPSELPEIPVATPEQSGLLCFHSR